MKKGLILFITVFALSACTTRLVDFTIISTKNLDLSKGATFERGRSRVEGEDLVHWIFFIPTGIPSMKEAIDRAIESTPGCVALLDGVVYSKFWQFFYGQQSYIVEGTPLIDPSIACNPEDIPTYGKIELDRNGEIESIESISAEEYFALKDKIVKNSEKTRFWDSAEIE